MLDLYFRKHQPRSPWRHNRHSYFPVENQHGLHYSRDCPHLEITKSIQRRGLAASHPLETWHTGELGAAFECWMMSIVACITLQHIRSLYNLRADFDLFHQRLPQPSIEAGKMHLFILVSVLLLSVSHLAFAKVERICPIQKCDTCLDRKLQKSPGIGIHLGLTSGYVFPSQHTPHSPKPRYLTNIQHNSNLTYQLHHLKHRPHPRHS